MTGPPRSRGSRRPHADAKVAQVRRLIEETELTYGQIAARSGVGRASICRWTRDGGWKRPAFAPRATDTVPTARAGARLKMRTLAARLNALAERYLRELEETPGVDLDKLAEALELAKLAMMGRRRRRRDTAVDQGLAIRQGAPPREAMRPIAQLCAADVDLHRAPRPAIDDYLKRPVKYEIPYDSSKSMSKSASQTSAVIRSTSAARNLPTSPRSLCFSVDEHYRTTASMRVIT